VLPQRKPIRHPAIPGAEIQHIKGAAEFSLDLRQNLAFKIAIALAANGPLRRVPSAQIPVRKRPIICGLHRTAAFGAPDGAVVFEKLVSRAGAIMTASGRKRTDGGRQSRATKANALRADRKHPAYASKPADNPVTYDGGTHKPIAAPVHERELGAERSFQGFLEG
jgi:hypothetical protein